MNTKIDFLLNNILSKKILICICVKFIFRCNENAELEQVYFLTALRGDVRVVLPSTEHV